MARVVEEDEDEEEEEEGGGRRPAELLLLRRGRRRPAGGGRAGCPGALRAATRNKSRDGRATNFFSKILKKKTCFPKLSNIFQNKLNFSKILKIVGGGRPHRTTS